MFNINKRMSVHSGRLERWLGADRIENLSQNMAAWYGPPICMMDCPGSVWLGAGGDFSGDFDRGFFASAYDSAEDYMKRLWKAAGKADQLNAGFTSISDALGRASAGHVRMLHTSKTGVTGVVGAAATLWNCAGAPPTGAIGSAAPGGRACTDATTGAIPFDNISSGTLHLVGADASANVLYNSLLLYDRLFDVAKSMNSTAAESVTGVPTRYQSSTVTDMDYAGGNFMFPEAITALAATAHTWDAMLYRNQAGTDAQTAPALVGVSACSQSRLDMPVGSWFAPLATGDSGVMDLNSMKLGTAVATGTADWVIGHAIGFMGFPLLNIGIPFDWLTKRQQAPRVFDDACLSYLEMPKPATGATIYWASLHLTGAAP